MREPASDVPESTQERVVRSMYTVRIVRRRPRYNALVLYLGAMACVHHVPVQYHAILAANRRKQERESSSRRAITPRVRRRVEGQKQRAAQPAPTTSCE